MQSSRSNMLPLFMAIVFIFASGCSVISEGELSVTKNGRTDVSAADVSENQNSSNKHTESDNATTTLAKNTSKNEVLSAGKAMTIETSQGKISVVPTVVDASLETKVVTNTDGREAIAVTEVEPYYDPFESWNRFMFSLNHYAYTYVLIPIAKCYAYILPDPVEESIENAFENIREPLNLLSNLFSGEVKDAGTNAGRFVINSTVGVLGLFDPAKHWFEIEPARKTVSQMLTNNDVGAGAFLVLPFFGQSDVRGATSIVTESILNPLRFITSPPETYQLQGLNGIDTFAEQAELYEKLYKQANDPYLYFRNQYIQGVKRDAQFTSE